MYMRVYIYIYTPPRRSRRPRSSPPRCRRSPPRRPPWENVHICIHTYNVYVYIYIYTYIHTYIHMYIHTHTSLF